MLLNKIVLSKTPPTSPNTVWAKPSNGGVSLYTYSNNKWGPIQLMDDMGTDNPDDDQPGKVITQQLFDETIQDLKDYVSENYVSNIKVLITTPPATLNAQVGYYYCMGGSGVVVNTMTIQLPAIADKNKKNKTKNVQFFMTMGSAPEVTFVSAGTERILYQKDFALEAERSYEVNALWNDHAWVITVVEIIVPFFAKLSLNNGEVVELQGSGELTSEMVSQYKSSLVSAEIGELCTSIGWSAFRNCSGLTSITIPNSVTRISSYAFYECSGLKSIEIPNSVTRIGESAFYECSGLTSITIPNSVTSIGQSAFQGCSSLTNITIGNGTTYIGKSAFASCTSLPVVDNIRYADTYAVEAVDKTLTTYTLKEDTRFIGTEAFSGCTGLTSITIPDSVTSIGYCAFSSCKGLTNITIPNSVTSIGEYAFSGCTGLTSIVIPDSVTTLDDAAFSGCKGLTSITIGSGVTYIDQSAFNSCSSLTSITIPNNVTDIASSAFGNCWRLTSIISLATTAPTIESDTFRDVKKGGTLTVPRGSTGYGEWMDTRDYYLGYYDWTKVEQ